MKIDANPKLEIITLKWPWRVLAAVMLSVFLLVVAASARPKGGHGGDRSLEYSGPTRHGSAY